MDQSPTQCLKSGPPRRRDRDWRSARLLAPTALALQTRKTAMKKTPMQRLAVVSYHAPSMFMLSFFFRLIPLQSWSLRARIIALQPELHQLNLRLLICDDLLSQPTHLRVFAVQQERLGHVDGTLVMGNHHGHEVTIRL